MLKRTRHRRIVNGLLRDFPVVGLLGARQVGKTTLAKQISTDFGTPVEHFDLEDPADLARLEDPGLVLSDLRGLIVIDEIQKRPDLFPVLRVLADRRPRRARFLVLGCAAPELLQQTTESLAGRIAFHTLEGFALDEVGERKIDALWVRGGFPRSLLARSNDASWTWRANFIRSFIERDLPQLGVRVPGATLSRFWSMLAHYHGQTWNASAFARSFGVSDKTVNHYLGLLTSSLVVRSLAPWHANLRKRQVKAPKIFLRDPGILHSLLGIRDKRDLERHPKLGASWEGFVIDQLIQHLGATPEETHFWATHTGAELDFLWTRGRKRIGFEVKRTSVPKVTRSLRTAIDDLGLQKAYVVHAGKKTFPLDKKVIAVAASRMLIDL